ncbi:MAG TPA: hypothetical protein VEH84_19115 [Alphaproteobacteria bacterium]|nr:hypothetical protein [Alphaproteobacteria bacterium]
MSGDRLDPTKGTAYAPFGGPDRRDPSRQNQSGQYRRNSDRPEDAQLARRDIGGPDEGGLG